MCSSWIVGFYSWLVDSSSQMLFLPQHTKKHVSSAAEALDITTFTPSLAPTSRFLIPVPINPPFPQSPEGCSWETTLLEAATTPDDHLSPPCPASCPATCPVLTSKQSLTFTHYHSQNSAVVSHFLFIIFYFVLLLIICLLYSFSHASGVALRLLQKLSEVFSSLICLYFLFCILFRCLCSAIPFQ